MGSREQIGRNCPYCGAIITYDEFFCRACHKRLHDQQDFNAPSTVKPEAYAVSARNLFIAGILSAISPGPGQFYNGEALKGFLFFLAFIAISFDMIPLSMVTANHQVFFYGIWVLAIIDALYSARQINHFARLCKGASWFLYPLLALYVLIVALHLCTGQPDVAYLGKLFPPVILWSG